MTQAEEELMWQLEHDYWLCSMGGRRQSTDASSIAVFGGAAHAVTGDALERAHAHGPEYEHVELTQRAYARPSVGVAVLGYTVVARDRENRRKKMVCTSVWLRRNGIWTHIQHQQSLQDTA
ncbi:hypothetical protein [Profundibacterium mesophilum]|uniref:DUF4440 domain-containing protein n=1 Tax=Profundibacterium mesophilum KAUST100406-0324 TaxID=1037889 RepID=A0A921NUJ2_9RHOB|nr:hypothetical protein [Profundibacterium mesophilum]KAF0675775.1 hypothetical protein PMES_01861 [Profundibacterium mesophilum KAUST100406-0324]